MRFMIFSLPRCGSTTLARALNCYPGVHCALEPFIPENLSTTYGDISDAETLDRVLTEIWRGYNGIKHVWYITGWPFGVTLDLNHRLLRSKTKIIFLSRRNELSRIVSGEMSWQTGVWGNFTEADRERVRGFDYKPLTPENIERQLHSVISRTAELRDTLRDAGTSFLELQYEDLFADDVYLAERLQVMDRLREFIGVSPEREVQTDFAVADLLNPATSRLNLPETYLRIPNIDEIEHRFGSDESGWLFKARDRTVQERADEGRRQVAHRERDGRRTRLP
jgi:hypothetical protein